MHQVTETHMTPEKANFLGRALETLGKSYFWYFFIYFEMLGQATFSSSIFHNGDFFASGKIEIDLISSTQLSP